jgi:hypothetical protein
LKMSPTVRGMAADHKRRQSVPLHTRNRATWRATRRGCRIGPGASRWVRLGVHTKDNKKKIDCPLSTSQSCHSTRPGVATPERRVAQHVQRTTSRVVPGGSRPRYAWALLPSARVRRRKYRWTKAAQKLCLCSQGRLTLCRRIVPASARLTRRLVLERGEVARSSNRTAAVEQVCR